MSLKGKTAVITGSGRGIGRGIALALAAQGCNIGINFFRRRAEAEKTAAQITTLGAKAALFKAHVGKEEQIRNLVEQTAAHFGSVDIFVGNAASGVQKPVMQIDAKAWDWTLNINARSILFGAQVAAKYMKQRGWGRILTISSIGSRRVLPEYSVVGISKAAIETLTRYLAVELAPDNITTNCISPGIVLTEALDTFPSKREIVQQAQKKTPIGRLATPDDIGALAAWLCSDSASLIVGQTIEVDGGYSLIA